MRWRSAPASSWMRAAHDYLGIFLAGTLFSFGFTTPISMGFLINVEVESIILAALLGGFGAMLADLTIFKVIRFSFMDEIKKLEKTKAIKRIEEIVENNRYIRIKHYLLYVFSGLIIASPLPDEIGVSILAGLTHIKPFKLALISFCCNTLGIFIIIYLGVKII